MGPEEEAGTAGEEGEPEVVAVTGASAGVGRAVARAFAERGARLALLARGRAGLESRFRGGDRCAAPA